ncbi:sodium:calcium exchanger, partial [filamentous cyanobacterium Phorm 6]
MGQIIINEFRRATGDWTGNEYVELLLTEDLTATQLQSYFVGDSTLPTTAKYSAYQFTNMASIAPVFKAGTIIAIGGSPANQEIAYNPIPLGTNNDWNIRLSLEGGFLTKLLPVGNFDGDFAASDVVYVDNTSTTNFDTVDAIAWRTSGTHGAFGSAAKVQIPAPSNGGTVEFSSALGGVNRTANYAVNSLGSIGLPNGGINTIYINSLRNPQLNNAPTLGNSNFNTLLPINEDTTNAANTGFTPLAITSELGSNNANSYALGVAVTAADNTNGNWQFSTNGNTWTNFDTLSETSATVLGPSLLYNGSLGNTPSSQNWLSLTNLNSISPADTASEILSGNGINLNSTAADSIYAGYTNNPLNPSFPPLNRNSGFSLSFNLQIISESRTNQNRAGFSIIAVTSDRKSIEIGFQQLSPTSGNIFAQGDDITPNPGGQPKGLFVAAENVGYNTNNANDYTLRVQGDNYFLSDGSNIILTGPLRNYAAFSGAIDPYETPNFLFLGDDTTSAQANINLTRVSLQTPARVRFLPNPDYYSTPGNEPTITFRAWDGSNGVASGTTGVNASVTGGTTPFSTNAITSAIAVNPVNDAPSFVKGPDRTLNRNAGPQTVPGWATAIFPGPANESAQTVSFQVAGNDNAALFSVLPAIDSLGQLTFTPAIGAIGSANITLNLKDSGGTDNGGVDTSANQTFAIDVINNEPIAQIDTYNTLHGNVLNVPAATGVLANDSDLDRDLLTANLVANPNSGTIAFNNDGSFIYTPNPGFFGLDSFTYSVSDGVATASAAANINVAKAGTFNFSATNYRVNENGNFATITVTRTDADNPADVSYSTSDGTAGDRSDYNQTAGTLSFGIGETSQTFTVSIIDDSEIEGDQTVNLTLRNSTNGFDLGSISSAVLTIVDTTPTPSEISTPTPSGTPTPTPTPTGTPTPTPSPSESSTPTPSEISTPTPSEISTPTPTPTPTGTAT